MQVNDLNVGSIVIFAILVLVGGIMGFVKGKSKASLIAGVSSAGLLFWCALTAHGHSQNGIMRALLVIAVLEGIFVVRLVKTKKFMPSGMMLILCLLEQAFLLWNCSRLDF
jgi:uncharacterized membrane protein (UPF0136 family)